MQRRELGGAERGRLHHEMTPEQIFMLDNRALERFQNNARREKLLRQLE